MKNVKNVILKIISKKTGVSVNKINMKNKISNFKKWDSLANVEILIEIQNKMKKKIDLSKLGNIKTISDLIDAFK
tara:strand:+ start:87 stop:311 length:225 start_codon:yes stop_codon:yes gene_type:complete